MKFLSIIIIILLSLTSIGQNINGQAFYQSKTTVDMANVGGRNMDENMRKMVAERMKSYLEKTYVLTFNDNESIYLEEEKLETGASGGRMGMMMGSFSAGKQYKNLKTKYELRLCFSNIHLFFHIILFRRQCDV